SPATAAPRATTNPRHPGGHPARSRTRTASGPGGLYPRPSLRQKIEADFSGTSSMATLIVNGKRMPVDADPDTPLLWVLRDHLNMTGTKYGCGMALCGACTVHVNGQAARSCQLPLSAAEGKRITTIEAVGQTKEGKAVQDAWVANDVPQCGYCQSGQI